MSHVDDGQLHAYLDGALPPGDAERIALEDHLRGCADCRALLETARQERGEAAGILGLLEPEHIHTPPFETLLALRQQGEGTPGVPPASGPSGAGASGSGPGRPSRGRRLVPLAWAASLAAAIGGGWMAHGVWSDTGGELRPGAAMESAADEPRSPDATLGVTTGATTGAPPGAPSPAEPDQVTAAAAEVEAAALALREAEARAAADSLRTVVAALQAAIDTLRPTGMNVARLTPPGQQTTGTVGGAAAAIAGKAAADAAAADALTAQEPPGAPQAEPTAAELTAIAELELIGRVLGQREVGADLTGAWQPVTPAEAADALGRMPFDLDELPWDQMELARVEGQALLRTRHPLPEGAPLVVVQVAWPGVGDLLLQERVVVTGPVQGQSIRIPFTVQRAMETGAEPERPARPRALSVILPLRDGVKGVALVLGPGVGAAPEGGPDTLRRADVGAAAAAADAGVAAARGERALPSADAPLSRMAVWIEGHGAALLIRGPGGPGELEALIGRLR